MTKEEAIFYIKELQKTHASMDKKVAEAVDMAIEALKAEPSTEGKYEKAIKTLQEMPKYINSNIIGKKIEVLNHTKGNKNRENK